MGHLKQICEPLMAHEGTGGGTAVVGEEAIKTHECKRELEQQKR